MRAKYKFGGVERTGLCIHDGEIHTNFEDRRFAMALPERRLNAIDRSIKSSMIVVCVASFALVTWALVSPDPFAAVQRSPFSFIRTISDLVLHLAAFSVFAGMCGIVVPASPDSTARKVTVIGLVIYAVGTELLQQSIPRRTCDPLDAIANLCGIAVGLYAASLVTRHIAILAPQRRA